MHAALSAIGNENPLLCKRGMTTKNGSVGKTNQRIFHDIDEIFSTSFVSIYSQIIDRIDIVGSEIRSAPKKSDFFASSDEAAIRIAEMITFRVKNNTDFLLS